MEAKSTNWVKEVALEHCLLDPRIDRHLRAAITFYVLELYLNEDQRKIIPTVIYFEDDVIVVHKYELSKGEQSYIAFGDENRKKQIQAEFNSSRKSLLDKVKTIIQHAMKNKLEPELQEIPASLLKDVLGYYDELKKRYKYRSRQIIESFSDETITKNQEYIKEYEPKVRLSDVRVSSEGLNLTQDTIKVGMRSVACIATSAGRPKIKVTFKKGIPRKEVLPLIQQDRAGVVPNITIDESWVGRIPELLAYVQQTLILEIYNNIPIKNWCDNSTNNISKAGATLTMVLNYRNKVSILSLGDSPAVLFSTDLISKKTKTKFLNWSHRPGRPDSTNKSEQDEYKRIVGEGGSITSDNRLLNGFGNMAMSRAIGDLEAKGMSDIGSISVTKLDSVNKKNNCFLFSDAIPDFLPFVEIKELCKMIKFEDLPSCLCTESYKNPRNRDNITCVGLPDNDILGYVIDGHGDECVAEYIHQILPKIFRRLAESPAPDAIKKTKFEVKRYKVDTELEKEFQAQESINLAVPGLSFFQSSETDTILPYNSSVLIKKTQEHPSYSELSREDLEKSLLEDGQKSSFFIRQATHLFKNHYVVHYLEEQIIKHVVFYIPTEFPMSYSEYNEIYNRKNIIYNENRLDDLLLRFQEAKELEFESEELTQPMNN